MPRSPRKSILRRFACTRDWLPFNDKVTVHSDKDWQACDVTVSFRDKKGNEIFHIKETIALRTGDNAIPGYEICSSEIWDGIQELMTTVDCIFLF
jgi:hypothetical protein